MGKVYSTERISDEYLALNACGIETFYDMDGNCLRKNGRVDYHILYVSEGFCYLKSENETIKIPRGNVILFKPGERQEYSFLHSDKSVSFFLHFTGIGCRHILEKLGMYESRVTYIGKNRQFEEIFQNLVREHSLKHHSHELYCGALLAELLAVVSRCAWIKKNNIGNRNEQLVENACRRIYENPGEITVGELAAECFLSVGYFSEIFKKITKIPPQQYINSVKIQKAKDMLINTDFPIGKVAAESGFGDQNYFSRMFKKITGVSPVKFRG